MYNLYLVGINTFLQCYSKNNRKLDFVFWKKEEDNFKILFEHLNAANKKKKPQVDKFFKKRKDRDNNGCVEENYA